MSSSEARQDYRVGLGTQDIALFELCDGGTTHVVLSVIATCWRWAQCTNRMAEFLLAYGPRQLDDPTTFDTSLYILPPQAKTPHSWDCEGFLLPVDKVLRSRWRIRRGPLAVKFWGFRRFWVKSVDAVPTRVFVTTTYLSQGRSTGRFRPCPMEIYKHVSGEPARRPKSPINMAAIQPMQSGLRSWRQSDRIVRQALAQGISEPRDVP